MTGKDRKRLKDLAASKGRSDAFGMYIMRRMRLRAAQRKRPPNPRK